MTETNSEDALLALCLQDLKGALDTLAERLPSIAAHAQNDRLALALGALGERAQARAARIAASGHGSGGPENLWMAGIVDDGQRDTRTIAPGLLLDLAIIGSTRKALAAEQASIETALALAERLGSRSIGDLCHLNHADARADDRLLAALLSQLTERREPTSAGPA